MGTEKKPERVQEVLAEVNNFDTTKEVVFNPNTGELEVVNRGEKLSPGAVPMTDVARDGFAQM